jgi:hypothetical protein
MKKAQLLSVVFSLIMFTGLSAGMAVVYAESDDGNHDFDDRLEHFCEMTDLEKEQLFKDHSRLIQFEERLTKYCDLDEDEREDLIDEFIEEQFANYKENDDWDMDDILDKYCEMSAEDQTAFLEKYPMTSDHKDKMTEYCSLDESEREAFIEEHKDEYGRVHDYDIKAKLDGFCEMSAEDQTAFLEKYPMASDHKDKMTEYCSLDESEREAFIENHKDTMKGEMSEHKNIMKGEMSMHKDAMKGEMCENEDGMECKMSDHKDSMTSDQKFHLVLKASTLTNEQKNDVRVMHSELRDMKHSLRDKSVDDDTKQDIRDQFMEKAKEFSMTWLSPRHQIAAGIDAQMVECREGFTLVMKTSNTSPLCVKETTAEKLIERGIAITAI